MAINATPATGTDNAQAVQAAPSQDMSQAPARAVLVAETTQHIYQSSSGARHGIPLGAVRRLVPNVSPENLAMAGGSGLAAHVNRLLVPAWCQLINDWPNKAEHPQRDMYATTDCGSQATAMAVYSATGVELPEGLIRDYISDCVGPLTQGLTTASDLVAYLKSPHCNFTNARAVDEPWPQVQRTIMTEIAAGRPVLILGNWYVGTLHWEVGTDYDALQGLGTNDPWDGRHKGITWQDYANRVNTGVVVLPGEVARHG